MTDKQATDETMGPSDVWIKTITAAALVLFGISSFLVTRLVTESTNELFELGKVVDDHRTRIAVIEGHAETMQEAVSQNSKDITLTYMQLKEHEKECIAAQAQVQEPCLDVIEKIEKIEEVLTTISAINALQERDKQEK